MSIPEQFSTYPCEDYFASEQHPKGFWDSAGYVWIISPINELVERTELEFLVIGRPGVDGIEFGYRKDNPGIWAYYPIENFFTNIAPDIDTLLDGWLSGKITV